MSIRRGHCDDKKVYQMQTCSMKMTRTPSGSANLKNMIGKSLIFLTVQTSASIRHTTIALKTISKTATNIRFCVMLEVEPCKKRFARPSISPSSKCICESSDDVHKRITTYICNHENQDRKDVIDTYSINCSTTTGAKRLRQSSFGRAIYARTQSLQHTNGTAYDREGRRCLKWWLRSGHHWSRTPNRCSL